MALPYVINRYGIAFFPVLSFLNSSTGWSNIVNLHSSDYLKMVISENCFRTFNAIEKKKSE